jgi:LuxR family quorum-sensing system transcriptional regulator CciR
VSRSHDALQVFVERATAARDSVGLGDALAELTNRLGFARYALVRHRRSVAGTSPLRLHNYPSDWVEFFDRNEMEWHDPVHRACRNATHGFGWEDLARFVPLSNRDHEMLALARRHGLRTGFTVPARVPGEAGGSCSFVMRDGDRWTREMLGAAELAGVFALEAMRRLSRKVASRDAPAMTPRQRECLVWVARGKSDWEISRILGVSHETVVQHLKQARDRYGVHKRTSLLIRALFDGEISFDDLARG